MRECVTETVVLEKKPLRETDQSVTFYTERLGLAVAKITSGRKITSKLSPHLEPMNAAQVRLVARNGGGYQITDALKVARLELPFPVLKLVAAVALPGEPDRVLWGALREGVATVPLILKHFGFDPRSAACASCGSLRPEYFLFRDASYACGRCFRGQGGDGFVKASLSPADKL